MRKYITIKGVKYLAPFTHETFIKMRRNKVEPNEIKCEAVRKEYKIFSNLYKRCSICGSVFRIGEREYKNISTQYFCNSLKCTESYEIIYNLKSDKLKKIYQKYSLGKREYIKRKRAETFQTKYGVKCASQVEGASLRSKLTKQKKYGNPNWNNRQKARETLLANYGTTTEAYSEQSQKSKFKQIQKYGVEHYNQKHIKNYNDYQNREFWILNFGSVSHNILTIDIQKACEYFGIYPQATYSKLREFQIFFRGVGIKTRTQDLLFDKIQSQNKILNAKNIIPKRELDIYLPENNLAIEYNGLLYHSQGLSNHSVFNTPNFDKNYHLQKTLECKSLGIQLFHIFEGENIDLWLSMINNKLGLNTRIYARNCFAEELRNSDCKSFLEENHLQGFSNAKIAIGLYHPIHSKNSTKVQGMQDLERKLVAVMTFGKPRFSKGYDYELIRFCSLKGYNIIGGASKLWKFFLKKYNPKSVVSYANLRFSNGGLYEKLGFSLKNQSSPNYFYFHPKDMILYPRIKFQKHKLSKLLDIFDENKSEVENMFANGYRRIYDCGNLVYEWIAV